MPGKSLTQVENIAGIVFFVWKKGNTQYCTVVAEPELKLTLKKNHENCCRWNRLRWPRNRDLLC